MSKRDDLPGDRRRRKRSVLFELFFWFLLSVAVAVTMIVLAERYLPTNF